MYRTESRDLIALRTPHRLSTAFVCVVTCVILLAPASVHGAVLDTDIIGGIPISEVPDEVAATAPDVIMKAGVLTAPDGRVLWGRNTDGRRAMASTTKIMTAVVVRENAELTETVKVSREAAAVGESEADIRAGETYTVKHLLEAMLVKSGNDAAAALAEHVGGSEEEFAAMMNDKAIELGLADTRFANPHGLDDFGHYTTAEDLATMTRFAMADEEFRRIVGLREVTIDGGKGTRTLVNSNRLLEDYTGANGVKTGWTGRAGYCLAATAERDATDLTAIVLGSSSEAKRFQEAETLLDWGFENYGLQELGSSGVTLTTVPVSDYLDVSVDGVLEDDLVAPVFVPDGEIVVDVEAMPEVEAPVDAGQRLGTMTVTQGERLVAQAPVVAAYAVDSPGIFERIGIMFTRMWRAITGGGEQSVLTAAGVPAA
jgi:D-alanyl-D-alanine carboxypeptidase (penicillin-binding protein 5/6)